MSGDPEDPEEEPPPPEVAEPVDEPPAADPATDIGELDLAAFVEVVLADIVAALDDADAGFAAGPPADPFTGMLAWNDAASPFGGPPVDPFTNQLADVRRVADFGGPSDAGTPGGAPAQPLVPWDQRNPDGFFIGNGEVIKQIMEQGLPAASVTLDGQTLKHVVITDIGTGQRYDVYNNDTAYHGHGVFLVPIPAVATPDAPAPSAPASRDDRSAIAPSRPSLPPSQPAPPPPGAPPPARTEPDWTTQVEWATFNPVPGLIQPIRTVDTGFRPLNFLLSKVLLPWVNEAIFLVDIPLATMQGLDEAARRSPLAGEYQAFMDMSPLGEAAGMALEVGPALRFAQSWLAASVDGLAEARTAGAAGRAIAPSLRMEENLAPAAGGVSGAVDRAVAPSLRKDAIMPQRPTPAGLDDFVPVTEGSTTLQPRQLSIFDIKPSERGGSGNPRTREREWRALMKFLFEFEPRPNSTQQIGGINYTFDAERRLVRVSTDKVVVGTRASWATREAAPGMKGFDYGHLGGAETFGTNDILLQGKGGHAQPSAMNRTGVWREAEIKAANTVAELQAKGEPFQMVAEVRSFMNGVPTEWRIFVESAGASVYESGWLSVGAVP